MNSHKTVVREMTQGMRIPWTLAAIATTLRNSTPIPVGPACAALLLGALSLPVFGQATVGLIGGVTSDSATGKPVAETQIVAHNLDKGTDYATVSGINGIFTFTNLEPGPYEVAATKNGFQKSSTQVEVVALRTVRVELSLHAAGDARP